MRRSIQAVLAVLAMMLGIFTLASSPAQAATSMQWNFGPSSPSGWQTDSGDAYKSSRGYGWNLTDGQSRQCGDRNAVSNQVDDTFCHATTRYQKVGGQWQKIDSPASWRADVPNGTYTVTVKLGESKAHGGAIKHAAQVEGTQAVAPTNTTSSKPFVEGTVTVNVTDGKLDVTFNGGKYTKIVSVVATAGSGGGGATTTTTTSGGSSGGGGGSTGSGSLAVNFQSPNAPVPSGYSKDNGDAYTSSRGYGWLLTDGQSRQCGDRNNSSDQVRDTFCHATARYSGGKATSSPASWQADLANGTYSITIVLGESEYASEHTVTVEGVSFANGLKTTKSNPSATITKQVTVNDGKLTVAFGGLKNRIAAISTSAIPDGGGSGGGGGSTPTTKPATTTTVKSTTTTTSGGGGGGGGGGSTGGTQSAGPTTRSFTENTGGSKAHDGSRQLKVIEFTGTTDGLTTYIRDENAKLMNWSKYAQGTAFFRVNVTKKPSNYHTPIQVCFWYTPNGYNKQPGQETCARRMDGVRGTGVYYKELGTPQAWVDVCCNNGDFDFSHGAHRIGIMVKDGNKPVNIMMGKKCGNYCYKNVNPQTDQYKNTDLLDHVPVTVTFEVYFVEPGYQFNEPSHWK